VAAVEGEGAELAQAKLDATLLWIKAQEDAGLDIIGDGEQSRQHFVHGFLERSKASTSSTRSRWASAPTATRRWCRRWWRRCG
jgi:methionine synthase II (cobalamin-independent)